MIKKPKITKLMRIDDELAKQIKDFADKNELSLIQASKEISNMTKKLKDKKIIKELKF